MLDAYRTEVDTIQVQLAQANHIAVFGHRSPDGDAIGSTLALGEAMENEGKLVDYYVPDLPSSRFSFLSQINKYTTSLQTKPYDCLILLDTAEPSIMLQQLRVEIQDQLGDTPTIVIDHHISNTGYGDSNLIDTSASSTCELLAEYFQVTKIPCTASMAQSLLMGVLTDTGGLTYEKDTRRTLAVVSYLIDHGADKQALIDQLWRKLPRPYLDFVGLLSQRVQQSHKVIASRYTPDDLHAFGLDKEIADQFIPLMTSIDHDGIFVLFKLKKDITQHQNILSGSIRTKSDTINVSEVAAHFGGGGHAKAAGFGFAITGDLQEHINTTIEKMNTLVICK